MSTAQTDCASSSPEPSAFPGLAVHVRFLPLSRFFISSTEFSSFMDSAEYVAKTYYGHCSQLPANIFPSLSALFHFNLLFFQWCHIFDYSDVIELSHLLWTLSYFHSSRVENNPAFCLGRFLTLGNQLGKPARRPQDTGQEVHIRATASPAGTGDQGPAGHRGKL